MGNLDKTTHSCGYAQEGNYSEYVDLGYNLENVQTCGNRGILGNTDECNEYECEDLDCWGEDGT